MLIAGDSNKSMQKNESIFRHKICFFVHDLYHPHPHSHSHPHFVHPTHLYIFAILNVLSLGDSISQLKALCQPIFSSNEFE